MSERITTARARELLALWTERADARCDDPSGVEYDLAREVIAAHASLAGERTRREVAEAECARLRVTLEETERARQAAEEERDAALELVAPDAVEAARLRDARDAERLHALVVARVALADAELILEERERQLTAALTAVAAERARCAAVCREVAMFYDAPDAQAVVAHACADEIERGEAGR
jgi:hypothetical protein